MVRRILLAADGTASARQARVFALSWAQQVKAAMTALAVLDEEALGGPEAVPLGGAAYKKARDAKHIVAARTYLQTELADVSAAGQKAGLDVAGLLKTGEAVSSLVAECDVHDLVVIGRNTSFDEGHDTRGSQIARDLLGALPRPVVIVPDEGQTGEGALIAFDGSVPAIRTLQLFALLGGIWRDKPSAVLAIGEGAQRVQTLAGRGAQYLQAHGYRTSAMPVTSAGDPAGLILKTAKDMQAGIVVMGAFGHRTWLDFLLGSTTTYMLSDTATPLFMSH